MGRKPTTPHRAAGIREDPPVSEPSPAGTSPAAIAAAVPPEDPLLLNLVQNYMRALEASGGLEVLLKKWFENAGWLTQLP